MPAFVTVTVPVANSVLGFVVSAVLSSDSAAVSVGV
jgi:hypothetical protein